MRHITITIRTDYANADGIAFVAAKALFKRFTRRPRFNTTVWISAREEDREGRLTLTERWAQKGKS